MARIAILAGKIHDDFELHYPPLGLKEEGHQVENLGLKAGETYVAGRRQKTARWNAVVDRVDCDHVPAALASSKARPNPSNRQ